MTLVGCWLLILLRRLVRLPVSKKCARCGGPIGPGVVKGSDFCAKCLDWRSGRKDAMRSELGRIDDKAMAKFRKGSGGRS